MEAAFYFDGDWKEKKKVIAGVTWGVIYVRYITRE